MRERIIGRKKEMGKGFLRHHRSYGAPPRIRFRVKKGLLWRI